jgi:hypothetical protein
MTTYHRRFARVRLIHNGSSLEHSNRRTNMINKSKLLLIGTVTALLVSGASLGLAQTAPTTGGAFDLYRLPNGGPAYKPQPNIRAATAKHHKSYH